MYRITKSQQSPRPCSMTAPPLLELREAVSADRPIVYRLRHEVYARELHQHPPNDAGALSDRLDAYNRYFVATHNSSIIGFVSVTPPGHEYSVDKYFRREELPFPIDDDVYEIRLLTLLPRWRHTKAGSAALALLMYAALRCAEAHGGRRVVAIGRTEVLDLYRRVGLTPLGRRVNSGAVTYELLTADVAELRRYAETSRCVLDALAERWRWRLDFPLHPVNVCYHGGAFFEAIGEEFDQLDRRNGIINADVLDAWFPPAPEVIATLREATSWLAATSPPTQAAGLQRAISRIRGIPEDAVLPGAGSSDLIFLAFREWLSPHSRVLLLDPCYGEYGHVCEQVIGCKVDRLPLNRGTGFRLDPETLESRAHAGRYDMLVLVNPNNPAGGHVARRDLEHVLRRLPATTLAWIDEAYVDYVDGGESLEAFAATSRNVVVCKSMSKVYALSGLRAAYLCANPERLRRLRDITPPWSVSLPAQVAAVRALEAGAYYRERYRETHELRRQLAEGVRAIDPGIQVLPSAANWVLCRLPGNGPDAVQIIGRCRREGVFLRGCTGTGLVLDQFDIRIAVKERAIQKRVCAAFQRALND